MNYYKEIIKKCHPDLHNNSLFYNQICKIANNNKNNETVLRNIYYRLVHKD